MTPDPGFSPSSDVIIIGAGLIGLAAAAALAEAGLTVRLVGESRHGEASPAAAGLLAPSVEEISAGRTFGLASRERYPAYLEWLRDRTGIVVPLNRSGILEVALDSAEEEHLRARAGPSHAWLDQQELGALEPSLRHALGALLFESDGAVDNVALLTALRSLAGDDANITWDRSSVLAVDAPTRSALTAAGHRYTADVVIVATGAWTGELHGLPRRLPIEPVRGQMLALQSRALSRPAFGAGIYLVPRPDGRVLAGSTMERVGFDSNTTPEALAALRMAAVRLCSDLMDAPVSDSWAGLRPLTPDLLPFLGRDPEYPSLLYACGHSRNGILMAPLTADCLTRLVLGNDPGYDLSAFSVTRFLPEISV